MSRLPKRKFPIAFRFALQDCPSRLPFRNALQDCTSGLPFRSAFQDRCRSRLRFKFALQDCPSGLSFRIALQIWPSRLSFGIALQDCLSGSPFQLRFGRSQKGSVSGSEKYHLSKYIFLRVPPSTPKYNAEANKSPMKLFKDGTLFIPPKALQFFSFVLGGSGGAACETVFHFRRMVLFRSRPGIFPYAAKSFHN